MPGIGANLAAENFFHPNQRFWAPGITIFKPISVQSSGSSPVVGTWKLVGTPGATKVPEVPFSIDQTPVEQIDVLPTLLSLLGVEVDPALPGRDLFDPAAQDGPIFFERNRPPPWRQRGVIQGNLALFVIEEREMDQIPEQNRKTFGRDAYIEEEISCGYSCDPHLD